MKQNRHNWKKNGGISAILALCVWGVSGMAGAQASDSGAWNRLESADRNERRMAMEEAYAVAARGDRAGLPEDAIRAIRDHAGRWEENSDKAILALGLLGDRSSMALVRSVWKECGQVGKNPLDDRLVLVPRMRKACVMALCKLGDAEAAAEVERLLDSDTPMEIAEGIECAAHGGAGRFADRLSGLLEDGRDAVNVAPSGAFYWLRVCDLAAAALVEAFPASRPEGIQPGVRWGKGQLEALKALARTADDEVVLAPMERRQVLDVAYEAVGKTMNVEKETADVIREGDNYVVTFPVRTAPQMTSVSRWRGPDYAARLIVDGRTGAVLDMKVAP